MADIYNKNDPPPPKTVQFLEAFLLKCLDIQGQPVVGVEECVLLLLLLLPSPSPFIHFQIRAWRIQKVQQQLGMGRRQTVRPLPFTRLPLSQSSYSIVRPRNTCLPQQHAPSIQPLDPDLLTRQAAYMRYSSVFSATNPIMHSFFVLFSCYVLIST